MVYALDGARRDELVRGAVDTLGEVDGVGGIGFCDGAGCWADAMAAPHSTSTAATGPVIVAEQLPFIFLASPHVLIGARGDLGAARSAWEQGAAADPTGYYSERANELLQNREWLELVLTHVRERE